MKKTSLRRGRTLSIRTRVLTIALVPCFVFLIAGGTAAGYLISDATSTRNYFDHASRAQRSALPLIVSLQEERRLTLRRLASFGTFQADLIKQRRTTDAQVTEVVGVLGELSDLAPDSVQQDSGQFGELMGALPELRARVDAGQVGVGEAFTFYNRIVDLFITGTQGLAQFAPDAESAYRLQVATGPMLDAADQMQRADALASANLVGGGLTDADFRVYQGLVSAYHLLLDNAIPLADAAIRERFERLTESPAWLRLISVEDALLRNQATLPISEDLWRAAARDVGDELMRLLATEARGSIAFAVDKVDTTLRNAIIAAAFVLLLSAAVFVFALRVSHSLIERLTRLRRETLDLAETKLPELVERVRAGQDVTADEAPRLLDHGRDEIGEVANAFNQAQRTALTAAVQEARTREGTKTVFLNIAHRSQVIVHRQLKVLDEAERGQEDPEQLELLFQLDHLSTRARRNAENLIILGGGQPGRRWRKPVSLTELARGAAAETEHFARVRIAKLPRRAVIGPAVGDLVHLLAELIDNATSFSPPESRVEVRGNIVGRGVAVEIEDQGLGIEADRIEQLNGMLAHPPDFGIMALSTEPRLGLFVVARLAARHGISVSLRESAYGGTRAIVLIRAELLDEVPDTPGTPDAVEASPPEFPRVLEPPTRILPLPASFLQPLPEFPVVAAKPGEDLFRPQRPVDETEEPPAPTPPARPRSPAPVSSAPAPAAAGRPPLPQRRRQQNLAPQLREEPVTAWPEVVAEKDSPDAARSRLSAFVQGTRRGRAEPGNGNGENTVGSVRNGQHRAE